MRVEGEGMEERNVVEGAYKMAQHPLMHHTYDYLGSSCHRYFLIISIHMTDF